MNTEGNCSQDDTLEKMLSFNCNQPIKEEVTFEDSDDEETQQLELNIKNELFEKTLHSENILKIGGKKNISQEKQNKSRHEATAADVLAFSFEQIDDIIISTEEEGNFNEPILSAEICSDPSKKTSSDSLHINNIKNLIDDFQNRNSNEIQLTHSINLEKQLDLNNSIFPTSEKMDPITEKDNALQNNNSLSMNNQTLYRTLLKTVIENMFLILQPLNKYILAKGSKNSEKFKRKKELEFNKIKLQYFSLSYSTVASILLPHKNNKDFMQKFQSFIKKYADGRGEKTTEHNISVLCAELMLWTEEQKNKINSDHIGKTAKRPLLKNVTNPPRDPIIKSLLSNGGPASQVMPPNLQQTEQNGQLLIERIHQDLVNVEHEKHVFALKRHEESLRSVRKTTFNQEVWNQNNIRHQNNVLPNGTSDNVSFFDLEQNRMCTCNLCRAPPSYEELYAGRHVTSKYFKTNENMDNNLSKRNTPRDRNAYPYSTTRCEPPHYHFQERSLSRDSGYLSPVSSMMDPLAEVLPEETAQNRFPVIVNVTSMHTDVRSEPATKKRWGFCQICQKQTNLRCLGCNFIFYCNELCQEKDWSVHINYCKKYKW